MTGKVSNSIAFTFSFPKTLSTIRLFLIIFVTYTTLSFWHETDIRVSVELYPWFKFGLVSKRLFSSLLNSLSYITIPESKTK